MIDIRTISPVLTKIFPKYILFIKILELLILIGFLAYSSQQGLHITIQNSPFSFLSFESLLWLKSWLEWDILFASILLLFTKNILWLIMRLFIDRIEKHITSRYLKIFMKIFSQIMFLIITLITLGSALGVIFKCYYSYISNVLPTGILFTICSSIVIWRKLSPTEIIQIINTEINNYVVNNNLSSELIYKEFVPYLKKQFLTNFDEISKIFYKEGYYSGLSYIQDQTKSLHVQFMKNSQESIKEVIDENITSTSWGIYILGAAVAVIIICLAGYGIYKYLYPNPPAPAPQDIKQMRHLCTRTLERDRQIFRADRSAIETNIVNNLGREHLEVLQKFHRDIWRSVPPKLSEYAEKRQKIFDSAYYEFIDLWRKNKYNLNDTITNIHTTYNDPFSDKVDILTRFVYAADRYLTSNPKSAVNICFSPRSYEDYFIKQILGSQHFFIIKDLPNHWKYSSYVPNHTSPNEVLESYMLFNQFILDSNFTRNSKFKFFKLTGSWFSEYLPAVVNNPVSSSPQFWLRPDALLSWDSQHLFIEGNWDPTLNRLTFVTNYIYFPMPHMPHSRFFSSYSTYDNNSDMFYY